MVFLPAAEVVSRSCPLSCPRVSEQPFRLCFMHTLFATQWSRKAEEVVPLPEELLWLALVLLLELLGFLVEAPGDAVGGVEAGAVKM